MVNQAAFSTILQYLLAAILIYLIRTYGPTAQAWLATKIQYYESNLSDQQRYAIDDGIKLAVHAAEQNKLAGFITDKKVFALKFAEKWIKAQTGIDLDLFVLDGLVEAEVHRQFGDANLAKPNAPAAKPTTVPAVIDVTEQAR